MWLEWKVCKIQNYQILVNYQPILIKLVSNEIGDVLLCESVKMYENGGLPSSKLMKTNSVGFPKNSKY